MDSLPLSLFPLGHDKEASTISMSRTNSSSLSIASSETIQGYKKSFGFSTQVETDSAYGIDLSSSGSMSGSTSTESTSMADATI